LVVQADIGVVLVFGGGRSARRRGCRRCRFLDQQPVQCRQLRRRERVQAGLVHFCAAQALFETGGGILRLCRHCSSQGQGGAKKHLSQHGVPPACGQPDASRRG
jgi:hypothetical protein